MGAPAGQQLPQQPMMNGAPAGVGQRFGGPTDIMGAQYAPPTQGAAPSMTTGLAPWLTQQEATPLTLRPRMDLGTGQSQAMEKQKAMADAIRQSGGVEARTDFGTQGPLGAPGASKEEMADLAGQKTMVG